MIATRTQNRINHRLRARACVALGIVALCFTAGTAAGDKLTINLVNKGGDAPADAVGGGTFAKVIRAAADWWENSIAVNHTVTIEFGWSGTLDADTLGGHTLVSQGGTPNRETAGTIFLNNTVDWFIDNTPHEDSEFDIKTTKVSDLSNADKASFFSGDVPDDLVIGRGGAAMTASLAVGRFDLLSVVKHELGHALGLSSAHDTFQTQNQDGDVDIDLNDFTIADNSGLDADDLDNVFAVGTRNGAHLDPPTSLMFPTIDTGERRLMSHIDILANAAISDFGSIDLNPVHVPLPPAAWVGLAMLGAVGSYRRRMLRA